VALDVVPFLTALVSTVLWSIVAVLIATAVFAVLDRRFKLMEEIFQENSVAAAILAASFVIGIFYTVTQIVIH
jgi:uncharacterized membrane protein YjfL (UPF0719 family)